MPGVEARTSLAFADLAADGTVLHLSTALLRALGSNGLPADDLLLGMPLMSPATGCLGDVVPVVAAGRRLDIVVELPVTAVRRYARLRLIPRAAPEGPEPPDLYGIGPQPPSTTYIWDDHARPS